MMDDDRTVFLSAYFPLTVEAAEGVLYPGELRYLHSFTIGRSEDCDVRCYDRSVSRVHVDVLFESGKWWVEDHQSRNGTFVDGDKVERFCLTGLCQLKLGKDGPILSLQVDNLLDHAVQSSAVVQDDISAPSSVSHNLKTSQPVFPEKLDKGVSPSVHSEQPVAIFNKPPDSQDGGKSKSFGDANQDLQNLPQLDSQASEKLPEPSHVSSPDSTFDPPKEGSKLSRFLRREPQESPTEIFQKVLRKGPDSEAGPSTEAIRIAYKKASQQRSRRSLMFLSGIGVLALFFGVVAWVQYLKVEGMKESATELFFSMKSMELGLSELENLMVNQLSPEKLQGILARREKLHAMQVQYENFLEKIGVYSSSMSEEDRAILRMARLFGECEIGMPSDFTKKVKSYIQKWKSTNRLTNSIQQAQSKGYGQKIRKIMLGHHLPPQFFYLGLQESNFNVRAVGPTTRFGIAKGPWQFIPSTASDFGLQNGPLVAYEKYDPRDERHNFEKATQAAAKYLKHIYTTEAQASGLLVMASYNWGQTRVRKLIRQLPENPRDRNFWELLKRFKIPRETYDYVFYIFSAAVIGENPALFGFSFPNPLEEVEG